jgi:hypothetical protein
MKSCHIIIQVDGHVLILTHIHPNFRTFKFTSGKLILGFFCIGLLLQIMLQRDTTSIKSLQLFFPTTLLLPSFRLHNPIPLRRFSELQFIHRI